MNSRIWIEFDSQSNHLQSKRFSSIGRLKFKNHWTLFKWQERDKRMKIESRLHLIRNLQYVICYLKIYKLLNLIQISSVKICSPCSWEKVKKKMKLILKRVSISFNLKWNDIEKRRWINIIPCLNHKSLRIEFDHRVRLRRMQL